MDKEWWIMEKKREVPFFARLLEEQDELPKVKTDVKAGPKPPKDNWPPVVTQKYPSDDDDDPPVVPM
jgi:hypothetical protein